MMTKFCIIRKIQKNALQKITKYNRFNSKYNFKAIYLLKDIYYFRQLPKQSKRRSVYCVTVTLFIWSHVAIQNFLF